MRAFKRLDSGRLNSGFGLPALSWLDIEIYCDRLGVSDVEQRAVFHHHITALDEAYLKHQEESKQKS